MFEKYNVTREGNTGRGGEYKPQVGFGWTNGVTLDLLVRFPELKVGNNAAGIVVSIALFCCLLIINLAIF